MPQVTLTISAPLAQKLTERYGTLDRLRDKLMSLLLSEIIEGELLEWTRQRREQDEQAFATALEQRRATLEQTYRA